MAHSDTLSIHTVQCTNWMAYASLRMLSTATVQVLASTTAVRMQEQLTWPCNWLQLVPHIPWRADAAPSGSADLLPWAVCRMLTELRININQEFISLNP